MPLTTDADIKSLLTSAKRVAVVGFSADPEKPSYGVAMALKGFGYEVYPVNPTLASTPELTVYPSLSEIPDKIDIVDVFRRADALPGIVEEAIRIGAGAVWMQLGIVNEEAAVTAEAAGLKVVMDHCMRVEYGRLMR